MQVKDLARKIQFFKSSSWVWAYHFGLVLVMTPEIFPKMPEFRTSESFRVIAQTRKIYSRKTSRGPYLPPLPSPNRIKQEKKIFFKLKLQRRASKGT